MDDLSSATRGGRIAFGSFCLTPSERLLTREGIPVEIGGRSLDILIALAEQPGRVVSKRELLKRVWPDVVVEDGSLRFHMAGLRKTLGDGEGGARYIATQVGVGYAFVAPVQPLPIGSNGSASLAPLDRSAEHRPEFDPAPIGKLPARLRRVIGRERDVQLLTDRIADAKLFTIVGAAGVGKTTLAVEIGHALSPRFANKVSFVDLGTIEDPTLVSSALAGALGILVPAEDAMTVILGHIRAQKLLLILDNCEHLINAVSAIVERIGEAAPNVNILATSREPLRVRGEHVHWLGALDYPPETAGLSLGQLLAYPAVELFVERAAAGNSALRIDADTARVIADMCRRLDGMALPIELTAVRVAAHGLDATVRFLGERFSLGWTGRRTALPRQQTLQATLDWSYDLLPEAERRTLERLSVFLGPFQIDAALDVVADGTVNAEAAVAALDELTAKSLISPNRSGGAGSYRLLEMTRAYAREKLLARGGEEFSTVARRHAKFFLNELEVTGRSERDFHDGAALFSHQLANVRSALDWSFGTGGDLSIGVALAAASAPVLLTLSLLVECRIWCARAIGQLADQDRYRGTSVELELQAALGFSLMFARGNSEAAETALRRALDIAVELADRWNQLRLLGRLHIFHERIGDFKTALEWAEMAVKVADEIGESEAIAVAASLAGISHQLAGDQRLARRELELSLQKSIPSDRGRTIYYGFDHRNRSGIALARTLWLQGYADQARRIAEQTVQEAASLEHPVTHCIALIWTLSVHIWTGDHEKAEASLNTFADSAEVNALGPYIAASGGFRGELAVQQQRAAHEGLGWLEESIARLRSARYELLTTSFSIALTQGLVLHRRFGEALELVDATIDRCNRNGELLAMAELLRVKAQVLQSAAGEGTSEIEALLLDSLAWGRRQGARSWELRSAIDLARLWMDHRPAEALALLMPLRQAFSEGFDTADLRASDLLLSTLVGSDRGGVAAAADPARTQQGQAWGQ
ncbi:winged helix-turn-helix domain-containing protein [Mesorhizobium sp. dw_380]|uniref:ATP-binding protein n=1 Tax=Mesorhizobium sp. dw_380 TaxID=2812001 RepID=UPI001BDE2216|nr:winged helix-turn-helix domain-containing protein [Mesorhizobium sp. dw_380]